MALDQGTAALGSMFAASAASGAITLQFDAQVRLEAMRLAVAGLGPGVPIRLLLLGAEQIEQYVRFGKLPPMVVDDGDKS